MATFTDDDFERFLALLREDPERQARLHAALGDSSRLETAIVQLAEAQGRTEERLAALTGRVDALAERIDELAQAQARTEGSLAMLTSEVRRLVEVLGGMQPRLDRAVGYMTEMRYAERLPFYLGRKFRAVRRLDAPDLDAVLDPLVVDGVLTADEAQDVRRSDAVLHARRRSDEEPTYIVVEASAGVGETDVRRAADRAQLLARSGTTTIGLVAGESLTADATVLAREMVIWHVTDGKVVEPAA